MDMSCESLAFNVPDYDGLYSLGLGFCRYLGATGFALVGGDCGECFLYAGSMQFLLVGLLAAGVDLGAVLLW